MELINSLVLTDEELGKAVFSSGEGVPLYCCITNLRNGTYKVNVYVRKKELYGRN